jgi:hypothetical protein
MPIITDEASDQKAFSGMDAIDYAPPSGKNMWARERPMVKIVITTNTHFAIDIPL